MKKVIHVMGPPGSGKGTQAGLITDKIQGIHFDTGRYLEHLIKENDPIITPKLRREFDEGILFDPRTFLGLAKKRISEIESEESSVIFSGSPRTLLEAFGDENTEGLMDFLAKLYGKENIMVFRLNVPGEVSIDRNSHRVVCSKCKEVFMRDVDSGKCDKCGGEMYRRTLDKPEVIKVRLVEYKERTEPIFKRLEKDGFKIIDIDGTPKPEEVFESIKEHL